MTDKTLDDVYTALAEGIDRHGPDKAQMFLAKVCLLMAQDLEDPARALALIDAAQLNMNAMR